MTRRTAQEVTVRLEARRTIWIGGQQVRDEPVHADLTVVPWLAAGHPAGLVVVAGDDDPHTQCLRHVAGGSPSPLEERIACTSLWRFVLVSLCAAPPVLAARSVAADRPIAVKLETSQPTAIALPEPVASVSVGLAPERISLDYDGPYLFLLPARSRDHGAPVCRGAVGHLVCRDVQGRHAGR